jgi:S1-C subfamily serine protease
LPALGFSEAQLVEFWGASVVQIENPDGSSGCGVVVTSDGYIVSTAGIVRGVRPNSVVKHKSGRVHRIEEIGSAAEEVDIAYFKIDAQDLRFAEIGDSDTPEIGSPVFAMGNPGGNEIFLKGGSITDIETVGHGSLLETSCQTPKDGLGWGIFDARGRLVGITIGTKASEKNSTFVAPIVSLLDTELKN